MLAIDNLKPCGSCQWRCRTCGQTWTCIEEGFCRAPGLVMCLPCWAVESKRFAGVRNGDAQANARRIRQASAPAAS